MLLLLLEIAGASGSPEATLHLMFVLIYFSAVLEQDFTVNDN